MAPRRPRRRFSRRPPPGRPRPPPLAARHRGAPRALPAARRFVGGGGRAPAGDIRRCFAEADGDDVSRSEISLRFEVGAGGAVTGVTVLPPAIGATPLGACLVKVGRGIAFAPRPAPIAFRIPVAVQLRRQAEARTLRPTAMRVVTQGVRAGWRRGVLCLAAMLAGARAGAAEPPIASAPASSAPRPATPAASSLLGDPAAPQALGRVFVAGPTAPSLFLVSAGGYGYTESVLGAGDAHHRASGVLAAEGRPCPGWASGCVSTDVTTNTPGAAQGSDDGWIGDPRFFVRADQALGSAFRVGGRLGLWLPGPRRAVASSSPPPHPSSPAR